MKREMIKFIVLLLVALGAAPAYSAFWQWSTTASNNASADPSINWAEGMSPSSVNDSARAMMARAAEYRDDISGLLTTAGTATAYTVATNQGLNNTPSDGQLISITMHATNGAAPTLSADSGGAFSIQTAPGSGVPAGTLVAGAPYTVKFSVANNAWLLRDFYGTSLSVPLGAALPYIGTTSPNSNFVFPSGQCISRTTYAALFAMVATTFGTCDGVTTFGLPDWRGRVPAGLDNMGGTSASRLSSVMASTTMGAVGGAATVVLTQSNLPAYNLPVTDPGHTHSGVVGNGVQSYTLSGQVGPTGNAVIGTSFTGITVASGGSNAPVTVTQPTTTVNYILRIL